MVIPKNVKIGKSPKNKNKNYYLGENLANRRLGNTKKIKKEKNTKKLKNKKKSVIDETWQTGIMVAKKKISAKKVKTW